MTAAWQSPICDTAIRTMLVLPWDAYLPALLLQSDLLARGMLYQ